jgi:putative membrane protein
LAQPLKTPRCGGGGGGAGNETDLLARRGANESVSFFFYRLLMTTRTGIGRVARISAGVAVFLVAQVVPPAVHAAPGAGNAEPKNPVPNAPNAPNARTPAGAAPSGAGGGGGLYDRVATDVPAAESSGPLVGPDLEILKKLHQDNQTEIAMGRAAEARGSSSAVKTFGRKLVADHTAADKKIGAYLKAKKLDESIFTAIKVDEPAEHDLDEHTGQSFDRNFCQKMIDGHMDVIDRVGKARDRTNDPELKKLLTSLLPTLQKHLKTARSLLKTTNGAKP